MKNRQSTITTSTERFEAIYALALSLLGGTADQFPCSKYRVKRWLDLFNYLEHSQFLPQKQPCFAQLFAFIQCGCIIGQPASNKLMQLYELLAQELLENGPAYRAWCKLKNHRMHINYALMMVTFAGGLHRSQSFYRYRNYYLRYHIHIAKKSFPEYYEYLILNKTWNDAVRAHLSTPLSESDLAVIDGLPENQYEYSDVEEFPLDDDGIFFGPPTIDSKVDKQVNRQKDIRAMVEGFEFVVTILLPKAKQWTRAQWVDEHTILNLIDAKYGTNFYANPRDFDTLVSYLIWFRYRKSGMFNSYLYDIEGITSKLAKRLWPGRTDVAIAEFYDHQRSQNSEYRKFTIPAWIDTMIQSYDFPAMSPKYQRIMFKYELGV